MSIITDPQKIEEILNRGVQEVIVKESLKKKLESGKKLRIKFGIDPTGSDLHIGHAVPLRKLRQFQDLGHQVILLIGDYTAMVGDPSGKNETRPMLTVGEVKLNEKTYIEQAAKVLDIHKVEVRHNSEWYSRPNFAGLLMELSSKITVARILERDDFQKRMKSGSDIQMQEIMYPLLQGYDSVALESDVEIGGADQKFNLLMGRKLQRKYNQAEQDIISVPILEGIDGQKKMSKSYNNYIALFDSPEDIFGKSMSIPDELIIKYFQLATDETLDIIEDYKKQLLADTNPKDIKLELARSLTKLYCGADGAKKGEENFLSVIQLKERPAEISGISPSSNDIITVLLEAKFASSKTDARKLIAQGGVKINDIKVEDINQTIESGDVIQKGKRFFIKVI